jgi:hypothetical protein
MLKFLIFCIKILTLWNVLYYICGNKATNKQGKQMAITTENLKSLRKMIPRGRFQDLLDHLQCSKWWLYDILNGRVNLETPGPRRVIEGMVEFIEILNKEREAQQAEQDSLTNKVNNLLQHGTSTTRSKSANQRGGRGPIASTV